MAWLPDHKEKQRDVGRDPILNSRQPGELSPGLHTKVFQQINIWMRCIPGKVVEFGFEHDSDCRVWCVRCALPPCSKPSSLLCRSWASNPMVWLAENHGEWSPKPFANSPEKVVLLIYNLEKGPAVLIPIPKHCDYPDRGSKQHLGLA